MSDFLIFDGISSEEFGASVSACSSVFKMPIRETETVSVNGKNGDLIIDHGKYSNIDITYKIFFRNNFRKNYESFCDFLLARKGYRRLEDTMRDDIFRMAAVSDGFEPDVGRFARAGSFDLTFNCKPQCYLKSGEKSVVISSGEKLFNPTPFDADPIVKIYCSGSGSVEIGDETVTIAEGATSYVTLDCDMHMAYEGTLNRGNIVTMTGWPVLKGNGNTGITYSGDVSKIEITPRWWKL